MNHRDQTLRVSCSGLCIIQDAQQQYLLGLNRNMLKKGQPDYQPIGGVFYYTDPTILDQFEATTETDLPQLRLYLPMKHHENFVSWFRQRQGRETFPMRELQEELVSEYALLPELEPTQVAITFERFTSYERFSTRAGATGILTYNLIEIFKVSFLMEAHQHTLLNLPAESQLRWFTDAEIRKKLTSNGIPIEALWLLE